LWEGRAPAQALLTALLVDTADLAWFAYERSMRPLITLAACLRRRDGGLSLTCAVATEYLRPAMLVLDLPHAGLARVAASSRDIAREAFAQLPAAFADPVVTRTYAQNAGAALLARQLAGAAHV
jgi:carbon-monoxide dehydrogenase medium subunit